MSVLIVAEAGVNHRGKLDLAFQLCDEAKKAGADVVKFQTYVPEKSLARGPRYDELAHLALSFDATKVIARYCAEIGIEFCSTPDDLDSLKFLVDECSVKRIKIGSGSLLYRPLVEAAFATGLPVLLSTGMATMGDVSRAFEVTRMHADSTLMHCVSLYPCPVDKANLRAIRELRMFGLPVGWSDHTTSVITVPCAAVALGATVIEKHLTLEPPDQGIDYACSLNSRQFAAMVLAIRDTERALGDGIKAPSSEEAAMIPIIRKDECGLQPTEELP
jgi:N-acetylneuraminate synthase/N,N'-diacetyllegionaminate synthase